MKELPLVLCGVDDPYNLVVMFQSKVLHCEVFKVHFLSPFLIRARLPLECLMGLCSTCVAPFVGRVRGNNSLQCER